MLITRCFIQPLRTSILINRSSKTFSLIRSNLKGNQLIKDRKFTTNQILFNNKNQNVYDKLKKTAKGLEEMKQLEEELSKLSLVKKFKKIFSEYYHVILAVHFVTSTIWFSTMFLIKVKFDLTPEPLLKLGRKYEIPEFLLEPLKNKTLQAIAVPFFLYKCVTPLRYYSTIACALPAIRYLTIRGLIQPRELPKFLRIFFGGHFKK